jgi:hypothetical protein
MLKAFVFGLQRTEIRGVVAAQVGAKFTPHSF